MKCENCAGENDGSYGSGRFCNKVCARGFSTKNGRTEISAAVSRKLMGKSYQDRESRVAVWVRRTEKFLLQIMEADFETLTYEAKRLRVFVEQNFSCASCGRDEWLGHPIVLELDHEDGNRANNKRENLRGWCPNCHSTTPTWRGRKQAFVSARMKSLLRRKEIAAKSATVAQLVVAPLS